MKYRFVLKSPPRSGAIRLATGRPRTGPSFWPRAGHGPATGLAETLTEKWDLRPEAEGGVLWFSLLGYGVYMLCHCLGSAAAYQGRVCRYPRGSDMLQGTSRVDLAEGRNDMAPL